MGIRTYHGSGIHSSALETTFPRCILLTWASIFRESSLVSVFTLREFLRVLSFVYEA